MPQNAGEVRFAAQSLFQNAPNNTQNLSRSHYGQPMPRAVSQSASINMLMDEFLEGFMEDGRMSVIRRFFCLFVTFDLFFISLLWLICILINGMDIYEALKIYILHYDVHKSLFDVVLASVARFTLLIFFYAILSINHWFVIALSTCGSCGFLIYKVFVFSWVDTKEPIFQVFLIIISFVLAWGETWFLDCRVIPKEKHARNYATAVQRAGGFDQQRQPQFAPFLHETHEQPTSTFYSPFETIHNSDEDPDDDEQDEEWTNMGKACVLRAARLLESNEWQIDRMTDAGDTIQSMMHPNIGKVWRLTAKVDFPPKLLLEHLFYKIEEIHVWNKTILESKILHKIDQHTDITYQVSAGSGMVKSRDFVNLRCWHLCRRGQIIDTNDQQPPSYVWPSNPPSYNTTIQHTNTKHIDAAVTVHREHSNEHLIDFSDSGAEQPPPLPPSSFRSAPMHISVHNNDAHSSDAASSNGNELFGSAAQTGLAKSLGARGFFDADGDEELEFADAEGDDMMVGGGLANDRTVASELDGRGVPMSMAPGSVNESADVTGNVYVSSAIGVTYERQPEVAKYVRGDNKLSCWATRVIDGKPDACIFEWLMCVDLKGYVPSAVLNKVYPTVIQEYMVALRKHCTDLKAAHRQQQRRTAQHLQSS